MIKLKELKFDVKENERGIVLPQVLTKELAEDIGWQIGDGCISINTRGYKRYRYKIAGDPIEEKWFHDNIVFPTKSKLFGVSFKPKIISDGSYGMLIGSKVLVYFYNKVIGLPLAPKTHITIPQLILNSDNDYIISCLRGIFDTDGSLYFKRKRKNVNHFPSIRLESVSKRLVLDIMRLLKSMNINCYAQLDMKRKPTAYGYVRTINRLFVDGKGKLDKWMEVIGFKNPKHITKYKIWKRLGFCPSNTKLEDRIKILEGKLDPYKFYKAKL